MSGRVFVDTGIWAAAVSVRDGAHADAVRFLDGVAGGAWRAAYTSDLVFAETLNWIRQKLRRVEAAEAFLAHVVGGEDLPPLVAGVLRVHGGRFRAATHRYRSEFPRGLSFTDWTSVVLMEQHGIGTIATLDKGFRGIVEVVP